MSNDKINWLRVSSAAVQLPRSVRVGAAAAGAETGPHGELLVYRARVDEGAIRGLTESFLRGDINSDNVVEVSDSVRLFNFLFRAGPLTDCRLAADVNNNNSIDLSDGIYGLNFLFMGGPAPAPPFPACGVLELVDGTLTCESAEICR